MSAPTPKVLIRKPRELKHRPGKWAVRVTIQGREKQWTRRSKKGANALYIELSAADRDGIAFDPATFLPVTQAGPEDTPTLWDITKAHYQSQWADWSAYSRRDAVQAAKIWLPVLVTKVVPGVADVIQRELIGEPLTEPQQRTLSDFKASSMPIGTIGRDHVKKALIACRAGKTKDEVAASTYRKRRVYLSQVFAAAVSNGDIEVNTVSQVKMKVTGNVVRPYERNEVGSPEEVQTLVGEIAKQRNGEQAALYYALLYYSGCRPSEGIAIQWEDCDLPKAGWGSVTFRSSTPTVGKKWTDGKTVIDKRGLKHRADGAARQVPVHPELVKMLRKARTRTHGSVFTLSGDSMATRFKNARKKAKLDSGVLYRPYSLRHTAATLWLEAGVPLTAVADRLGHSPDICMRVYAGVLRTEQERHNKLIEAAI